MKSTNSLARYVLLNDLDEALVAECLPPTMGGVVPAAVAEAIVAEVAAANAEAVAAAQAAAGVVIDEVPKPSGLARVGLFLKSGLGIGLAAGIVAVGVIAAALIGNLMRGDTPGESHGGTPGGTPGGIPGVSDIVTDAQPESEPSVTGEPGTTEEPGTSESGDDLLPEDARIAVCNGAGEILLPDVYPLWTEVWMPGQNGVPGSMASGDSEGMPPMRELLEALRAKSIRWDAGLSFVTAEDYRVTGITLYDKNGAVLFDVTMDEVAVLDERTNGGVYYAELGLLYTGRYIEEIGEHEESFFEVPFCLLIGEEPEETETEPETTNLVSAAYDTLPYRNARVYVSEGREAFDYPNYMTWESVDELFLVIDSMEAYEALYPREPVYDAAFFEENVLLFVYCYCPTLVFAEELIDIAIIDGRFCPVLLLDMTGSGALALGSSFVTAEVSRKDLTMPKGEVFVVIEEDRDMEYYGHFWQLPLTPEELRVTIPFENTQVYHDREVFTYDPLVDTGSECCLLIDSVEELRRYTSEPLYDKAFFREYALLLILYKGEETALESVQGLCGIVIEDTRAIPVLSVNITGEPTQDTHYTYVTAAIKRSELTHRLDTPRVLVNGREGEGAFVFQSVTARQGATLLGTRFAFGNDTGVMAFPVEYMTGEMPTIQKLAADTHLTTLHTTGGVELLYNGVKEDAAVRYNIYDANLSAVSTSLADLETLSPGVYYVIARIRPSIDEWYFFPLRVIKE